LASLLPFCICLCSKPLSLQSLCNHHGFQEGQNWQHLYDKELKLPIRNSDLQDRPPLQVRTIAYNDEAAPWSRSNYLMGTRLLPSTNDRDDIFSRTHLETLGLR
jgi:hypothetical protein